MNSFGKSLSLNKIYARYNENSFSGLNVLDNITFSLECGPGLVALTGPNGSGKSTILRIITGQLRPTKGRIIFRGIDITDKPSHKRIGLGCVFQRAIEGMCSSLTIEENLCLMLLNGSVSVRRPLLTSSRLKYVFERASETLSNGGQNKSFSTNLKNELKKYPSEFSGGEIQKICLLALLLQEPPPYLILADEPTLNLDQKNRKICIEMLVALSKTTMVLLATHDKELIHLCNRSLTLREGKLIQ